MLHKLIEMRKNNIVKVSSLNNVLLSYLVNESKIILEVRKCEQIGEQKKRRKKICQLYSI